jgi:hypothetical protein
MKRGLFTLALMMILNGISAHTKDSTETPNTVSRMPFTYDNRIIILDVAIKGSTETHGFILDSGAPTMISDSLTRRYDLPFLSSEAAFDAAGNTIPIGRYHIRNIELGGYGLKNLSAYSNAAVKQMPVLRNNRCEGLLGANAMRGSIWQIDYQSREIRISRDSAGLDFPQGTSAVRMKTDELGRPIVTAVLSEQVKINMIVDVAYNGSLLLPKKLITKILYNDSMSYSSRERYSTGYESSERISEYKYLRSLQIGDLKLMNVKVSFGSDDSPALIGNEFLEQYTLVLDFVNRNLALVPPANACGTNCC